MITPISSNYEPFALVRSPDVILTFRQSSLVMQKSRVTISTDTDVKIGRLTDTLNDISKIAWKYATLEPYGWPLDGSCNVMPETGAKVGVWFDAMSDEDGEITEPVIISCVLPREAQTFGWTFYFDDPTDVHCITARAVCYNSEGTVIDDFSGELIDHTDRAQGWWLVHEAAQYTRVDFTFSELNQPYRYLRIAEIDFGIARNFDRNSLSSVSITHEMVLDGSSLPAKRLVFEFDNSEKEFNILNPVEVFQFWQSGQPITAAVKLGDEIVNLGMYLITNAEVGANYLSAKVTAYDEVSALDGIAFDPGALAEEQSVTLEVAVEAILYGYHLDYNCNGLEDVEVSLRIDATHSRRDVLAFVAQAARATVWIDRESTVQIARPEIKETEDSELTADALYSWRGVGISEHVDGVTLTVSRELDGESDVYEAGDVTFGGNLSNYSNPCVAPGSGQDVADWLLEIANWTKKYSVKNRCDPAIEIGDTLKIEDIFQNDENAIVTGLDISYDGVLSATTKAVGEYDVD